jgi:hypothetical protein
MTVTVSWLRRCPVLDYKFGAGHNTIRGAAGVAILNAQPMHREGCYSAATVASGFPLPLRIVPGAGGLPKCGAKAGSQAVAVVRQRRTLPKAVSR